MARIFQQAYTRPVPAESARRTIKGVEHAWIKGEWHPVTSSGRYRVKSKIWYAQYRNEKGVSVTESTGCLDEAIARLWLADAVSTCELIRAGVMTRKQADDARGRAQRGGEPLAGHVEAYVEHLVAQNRSKSWIKQIRTVFARLGREANWRTVEDVTYDSFDVWLRKYLRKASARARNYYRGAVTAFFDWAVACGRASSSPLASYPVANVEADRRYIRRAFTTDELSRLIAATVDPDRALAYRLMALTGLRHGEVRDLTVGDLVFGDLAAVRLPAKYAKNRTRAELPLRSDLAAMLAAWVAGRPNSAKLFRLTSKPWEKFAIDMAAAGIPRVDADGRHLDLHSFRYTFNTALARAGVAPRVAQEAMRHSDPHLTSMVYTDPALLQVAEAVESLDLLR